MPQGYEAADHCALLRMHLDEAGRSARGVCEGVFALSDGDLYASARLSTANNTLRDHGGTRAYTGAEGTFTDRRPTQRQRGLADHDHAAAVS